MEVLFNVAEIQLKKIMLMFMVKLMYNLITERMF